MTCSRLTLMYTGTFRRRNKFAPSAMLGRGWRHYQLSRCTNLAFPICAMVMRVNTQQKLSCYSNRTTKTETRGSQWGTGQQPSPKNSVATLSWIANDILWSRQLFRQGLRKRYPFHGTERHIALKWKMTLSHPHGAPYAVAPPSHGFGI